MKRSILLAGQEVSYTHLKTRRAKKLTITVRHDASLMVSSPHYYPLKFIEASLKSRSAWILKMLFRFRNSPYPELSRISHNNYQKYRQEAHHLIIETIDKLNKIYHFSFGKVAVKRQTTIWGSCSVKGNLSFNYRILFLPPELSEYIIAHELCHLQEMNHSRRFWQLVELAVPDYQLRRRQLKKINLF